MSTQTETNETGTTQTRGTAERSSPWLRLLPLIFFGIIADVVLLLYYVMTAVQFVVVIVTGAPNDQMRAFGERLSAYLREILDYLIYRTDQMPFPFAAFPGTESGTSAKPDTGKEKPAADA